MKIGSVGGKGGFGVRARMILKCLRSNRQCGGRCLGLEFLCRIGRNDSKGAGKAGNASAKEMGQSIERLFSAKPVRILKKLKAKGGGPIQYITAREARQALAVFSSRFSLKELKAGIGTHPHFKIRKVSDFVVDRTVARLKKESIRLKAKAKAEGKPVPLTPYDKARASGIRCQKGDKTCPKGPERVRLFVRAWLEQGGRDFYTGKKINLTNAVMDHLDPLSKGGTNTADNLVITSNNINYWKSAQTDKDTIITNLNRKIVQPDLGKLNKLVLAMASRKTDLVKRLRDEIRKDYNAKAVAADRPQGRGYIAGRNATSNWRDFFAKVGPEKFNTVKKIEEVVAQGKDGEGRKTIIKRLLESFKLKKIEAAGGDTTKGFYSWFAAKGNKGGQQSGGNLNTMKFLIGANNGISPKDMPIEWRLSFETQWRENTNAKGAANVRENLNDEWKNYLDSIK